MTTQDDQPRPDLDAAIDAVVPALTAVSDDAAADSLRRTRLALAETSTRRAGLATWSWAAPAMIVAVLVVGVALWWTRMRTDDPPRVTRVEPAAPAATKPIAATPAPAPLPDTAAAAHLPKRRPQPVADPPARLAAKAPASQQRRADPLVALTQAVQAIPDDAWDRGEAGLLASLEVPPVAVARIAVPPLITPSVTAWPADVPSPGEP